MKIGPCIITTIMVSQLDKDQQLNFYYCNPVAIMDRFIMDKFICQPKLMARHT